MRWNSLSALIVVFSVLLSGYFTAKVQAGEECCAAKFKVTQGKIDALLAQWEAASKNLANTCPEKQKELGKELGTLASSCPIGSRAGETLALINASLQASIKATESCEASKDGAKSDGSGCEKFASILATRKTLIKSVSALACYASCGGSCEKGCEKTKTTLAVAKKSDFCAKGLAAEIRGQECKKTAAQLLISKINGLKCEKKAAALVAEIKKAGCDKSAAKLISAASSDCAKPCAQKNASLANADACKSKKGGELCMKSLAMKAKALAASWEKAPAEFIALSPEKRKKLQKGMDCLQKRSDVAKLMPETMMTLTDGLSMLSDIDSYLLAAADKDPELTKNIPEEVKNRFKAQANLIKEVNLALNKARVAFQAARTTSVE